MSCHVVTDGRIQAAKMAMILAVVIGGLVVGLAALAVGRAASHLISGASIKPHSISGNRLKPNTLTGQQIKESTLGVVPVAKRAEGLRPLTWHNLTLLNGWRLFTSLDGATWAP
jgi:hypothetical protein